MRMPMSSCLVALLLAASPQASHALIDPHGDSIGVYFDVEGNSNCLQAAVFTPFDWYLIVANPTGPIDGFECTVSYAGAGAAHVYVLELDLGAGAVDADPSTGGLAVTAAAPYPAIGDRVVLGRWRAMMISTRPLEILVGPGTTPSLPYDHPVLFAQGEPRAARTYTCDTQLPVATVNSWCYGMPTFPCTSPPFDVLALGVSVLAPDLSDEVVVASGYDATDGFDEGLDTPRAAPAGPGYLAVSIEHPDWPGGPRFSADKVARFDYGDDHRAWTLLVETDLAGPILLARDYSNLVDDFRLQDLQTGQVQEFQPYGEMFLFWGDGSPVARRYELITGPWSPAAPVAPGRSLSGTPRVTAAPNPFNPGTVLGFELDAPARAEIRVLSLRGDEVAVLGGREYAAGRHRQEWRGLDGAGRALPSGTYLARLYVNGKATGAASRLTLLR